MASAKKGLALLAGAEPKDTKDEGDDESSSEKVDAAQAVLDAFEAGDAEALSSALDRHRLA